MDEIPIDANTVNKALDIASESTKETRKELDKTGAKGIHKLAELLWASPIGRKADLYIAERPYKMKKALEEMQKKYDETIPTEYQVEPSSYIALKSVNELNYSLDEEHLKEMFENLLISDMDSRKKDRVLPSYIGIINELSKDDALFLKNLKSKNLIKKLPIIRLKLVNNKTSNFGYVSNYSICFKNGDFISIPPIILDNLLRLKIVEIPFDEFIADATSYEKTFEALSKLPSFSQYASSNISHLTYQKSKLEFTSLGTNFIDICLS